MNNKGFAVTGIIYTLMVLFIVLIIVLLSMFSDRKKVLDKFKNEVLDKVNKVSEVSASIFYASSENKNYKILLDGYYDLRITSSNGVTLNSTFYFYKNENIRIEFGNVNTNGGVSVYLENTKIIGADNSSNINNYFIQNEYNDRIFTNVEFDDSKKGGISSSSFLIRPNKNTRNNKDLDSIKYIRECIYSDDRDDSNYGWSEIMVIKNGTNIAPKSILLESDIVNQNGLFDYNLNNTVTSTKGRNNDSCITLKLDETKLFDIDYIKIWHNLDNRIYYGRKIMVSKDGENYIEVDNLEQNETNEGITVSAFEDKKTLKIGNKYFPVKKIDDATFVRIFYHNSKNGEIYWSSRSQLLDDVYDTPYKKSALKNIKLFKTNNKYEFILEYPDRDLSKYNRWIQENDITDNTILEVSGYKSINIDYNSFRGLKYNTGNYTVISGEDNKYAIGYLKNELVPAEEDNLIGGRINLWVRIDEYLKKS